MTFNFFVLARIKPGDLIRVNKVWYAAISRNPETDMVSCVCIEKISGNPKKEKFKMKDIELVWRNGDIIFRVNGAGFSLPSQTEQTETLEDAKPSKAST